MNVLAAVTALALVTSGTALSASTEDPDASLLSSPVIAEILDDAAVGVEEGDSVVTSIDGGTVTLPIDSGEPLTLVPAEGPTLSIALPQSTGVEGSESTPEGGAVVHDLNDGSVILPVVKDDGTVQILSVVDSADAPHTFSYVVDAAGGVALAPQPDGGAVVLGADGEELASIAAPWAVDNSGASVPTRYTIDGGTLTQHIEPAESATYPIVADPALTQTRYKYQYISVVKTSNYTNKAKQLGICKVTAGGGGTTCAISNSYTVETTVGLSFGLSKETVSAGINVSASKKVSGSVSCTSPPLAAGSSYKAWAVGTRTTYKIQEWKIVKAGGRTNTTLMGTSGTLSAFNPVVGFACGK
ncbi:hypothetical protein BH11ACT5_BH11ACT5_11550 [soil metagenome]